jgi:hypothetical protein
MILDDQYRSLTYAIIFVTTFASFDPSGPIAISVEAPLGMGLTAT